MADLTPLSPLHGYDETIGDVRLRERDLALVSLAIPLGGEAAATKAIKAACKLDLPEVGHSKASKTRRLIRMSPDQAMLVFEDPAPLTERAVQKALKGACYTTNQTDAWVILEISGPGTRAALERICPLDLDDAAFPIDKATRTMMEHLGVLIARTGDDTFLLMSASSSARSFLHAVETSVRYTR